MTRIVVVGSANVDLVTRTPQIPRPGETILGREFVVALGGKGANQAVGAARLGADVSFIARIGRDHFGDQCLAGYQAEKICTEYIVRDPDESTGVAMIAVTDEGENSIIVASGANMRLSPRDIEAGTAMFSQADVVLLQLEIPMESVLAAAQLGRKYHALVVLNPAPARDIPAELLGLVDVMTPNRLEAAQLMRFSEEEICAFSDERLAKGILGLGPCAAVVTLGRDGSLVAASWGWIRVAPFAVKVVDTTGAGDAFNAGLAVALGCGEPLDRAARYANACGALAAGRLGAQPSLPKSQDVELLLGEGTIR